jgi:hypothetical protein
MIRVLLAEDLHVVCQGLRAARAEQQYRRWATRMKFAEELKCLLIPGTSTRSR